MHQEKKLIILKLFSGCTLADVNIIGIFHQDDVVFSQANIVVVVAFVSTKLPLTCKTLPNSIWASNEKVLGLKFKHSVYDLKLCPNTYFSPCQNICEPGSLVLRHGSLPLYWRV